MWASSLLEPILDSSPQRTALVWGHPGPSGDIQHTVQTNTTQADPSGEGERNSAAYLHHALLSGSPGPTVCSRGVRAFKVCTWRPSCVGGHPRGWFPSCPTQGRCLGAGGGWEGGPQGPSRALKAPGTFYTGHLAYCSLKPSHGWWSRCACPCITLYILLMSQ